MFMTEDVHTVLPDSDVTVAVAILAKHGLRSIPVVNREHRLVGVLSRTDVLRVSGQQGYPFAPEVIAKGAIGCLVSDAMCSSVVTVPPDSSIASAVEVLDSRRLSSVVVVEQAADDEGMRVAGVLSRTDILRAFREVVFTPSAARITLLVRDGIDVMGRLSESESRAHLELRSYAEHRFGSRRVVFLALEGPSEWLDRLLESAWSVGIRVLSVDRPTVEPAEA